MMTKENKLLTMDEFLVEFKYDKILVWWHFIPAIIFFILFCISLLLQLIWLGFFNVVFMFIMIFLPMLMEKKIPINEIMRCRVSDNYCRYIINMKYLKKVENFKDKEIQDFETSKDTKEDNSNV